MKYFICCQIALIVSLIVLTESIRFDGSPRLSPQLRIGRADNGIMLELGHPRLSPMFRVGKRVRENINDNQNDGAPKRGVNGHMGLLPFMRTGRTNLQDFDGFYKNSLQSPDFDYQKMIWYYLLLKDVFQQDINPALISSEKDK
ncbi:uncharacterized protein [Onthophagus taurus]|uniref:uncharacterized protein n=1 Tax=Onthophagus taurus TaxID=166361 RepID=UPI0039BE5DB3